MISDIIWHALYIHNDTIAMAEKYKRIKRQRQFRELWHFVALKCARCNAYIWPSCNSKRARFWLYLRFYLEDKE